MQLVECGSRVGKAHSVKDLRCGMAVGVAGCGCLI